MMRKTLGDVFLELARELTRPTRERIVYEILTGARAVQPSAGKVTKAPTPRE